MNHGASALMLAPWIVAAFATSGRPQGIVILKNEDGALIGPGPEAGDDAQYRFGVFRALLIGIEEYHEFPALDTPVQDVLALERLLLDSYGFEEVQLLLNEQATREGILLALEELSERLTREDNLLLYFAGHGMRRWAHQDPEGFWIPVDATDRWPTWIDATTLRQMLRRINAQHILVISDSCFSGAMNRSAVLPQPPARTRLAFEQTSNQYLSSGGLVPVSDSGAGGHSPFARTVIDFLRSPPDTYSTALDLAHYVYSRSGDGEALPEFSDMKGDPRERGQFIFVQERVLDEGPRLQVMAVPGLPPGYRLPGGIEQIPVDPPVSSDPVAGAYLYRVTGQRDRHSEMVLVPGGYYRRVPGGPEISVEPFLVDRYEVDNARFYRFLNDNPEHLNQGLLAPQRGERQPRVQVSLQSAREFARWANKSLPTELQWEFAAGQAPAAETSILREFSWGDSMAEAPLPGALQKHAPTVLESAVDCSYWGAFGMSTGVRELCELPDPDLESGVVRGGTQVGPRHASFDPSWYSLRHRTVVQRHYAADNVGFRCVLPLPRAH